MTELSCPICGMKNGDHKMDCQNEAYVTQRIRRAVKYATEEEYSWTVFRGISDYAKVKLLELTKLFASLLFWFGIGLLVFVTMIAVGVELLDIPFEEAEDTALFAVSILAFSYAARAMSKVEDLEKIDGSM